ncbi:MAG: RNA methyltransferase [Chlamydiae bacterium]|nr:RNA methyltransferase [Chlamydiota bacterium]MBI3266778.1 RNA methyltransferase [Chlamydiota bacterium]
MKLSNVTIVLVEPKSPGNIGSVARVMKNTGLENLILISPCDWHDLEAKKMAVGDLSLIEKAKVYSDLKEALTPFRWTVATTRRTRRRFDQVLTPREVAQKIKEFPSRSKVALVFGPEDHGLSNPDLSLCHSLSTIPSSQKFPSLNLAQAVMVYAYEMYAAASWVSKKKRKDIAGVKELEGMYDHLEKMLFEIQYFTRGKPETLMESIRNFLNRADLSSRDVRILRGICSVVQKKVKR